MSGGGPLVSPPREGGFGTKLIEASINGQLGGTALFDWQPPGLKCTLTMPRGETVTAASHDGAPKPTTPPVDIRRSIAQAASRKVLLVEDEALIGMMMVDILSELGYAVIGPITNVSEASAAATNGDFEYAVLDINLKGELVYPVADLLIASAVPFVFVTGYSAERIDKRYAAVPTLQKPLQKKDLQNAFARAKPGVSGLASA